jgi:hypothetical protein
MTRDRGLEPDRRLPSSDPSSAPRSLASGARPEDVNKVRARQSARDSIRYVCRLTADQSAFLKTVFCSLARRREPTT